MSQGYAKDRACKVRSFPKRLRGHVSGGGAHGKIAEFEADEGLKARPQPSLAPCLWLERADPDDLWEARQRSVEGEREAVVDGSTL
jgi:hypothetical protein